QVSAQDGAGNTDANFAGSVTIALGTNPSGGTLSGTTTVTAVNGVATFSNVRIDRAGNGYTLQAAASGLTAATSAAFNVATPPPPGITLDKVTGMVGGKNTTMLAKGFDTGSPHLGDAILATVIWTGSTNVVDSVIDFLTDGSQTRAGNKYTL